MSAKKGLGRGFDSLIPTELLDESFDPTAAQDDQVSELRYLRLSTIHADPDQPRRHFDEVALSELAASIKEHGILQPIVVTVHGDGYQIVAGERRFRAAKMAGLEKVPVLVRTLSDQHRLELSLIENIQRHDLSPIETATAYAKLRDQFNLTLEEIGHRVGNRSISAISNTLRLLKLPKEVQQALATGDIKEGQARPLIGVDESIVKNVLPKIISEGWSVRKIEQYIAHLKQQAQEKKTETIVRPSYDNEIKDLRKRFATEVNVQANAKGSGKIVIPFKDQQEFERIKSLLG